MGISQPSAMVQDRLRDCRNGAGIVVFRKIAVGANGQLCQY